MSSIAFIMLETQSKATINRVFDEALPYMHKSFHIKILELYAVNRSALSFAQISIRGKSDDAESQKKTEKTEVEGGGLGERGR